MKLQSNFRKITLLTLAFALLSFSIANARTLPDYRFKIHNNTKNAIKKVLVREDGSNEWGQFDIGDGIPAGATEEMVWDKSTDNGKCHWFFKAVFDNGEDSEAVKFDFCEKDLVVEFD